MRPHPWPGYVLELRHCIERALLLAEGAAQIEPAHLGLVAAAPANEPRNMDEPSREQLAAAMAEHQGNVSRVANRFGLSRQAVYRRLQHHGLPGPR